MKKIAAILLFTLLFFNWYGYRILSAYLLEQSDSKLESRLDQNEYDESKLIELRIPINLPYHNDWSDYERFSGNIEIKGVHYKYVKRKVEKGELVLLCVPNEEKQMLESARDKFFKLVNDLQQNNSGKKTDNGNTAVFKGIFSEYQQEKNNWSVAYISAEKLQYANSEHPLLTSFFASSPEQPPELA